MKKGLLLSVVALLFALGCGGGSHSQPAVPPEPAKGLSYTDPATSGWRLVKDPASTPTRLLLNLVGPSGLLSRGAGFNLQLPKGVAAGEFEESKWPIRSLGVYTLYNTNPAYDGSVPPGQDPLEPILIAGGVKPGNLLTVGIFQKDRRDTAKDSGRPLCQIALEFDAKAQLSAGDMLPLTVTKSRYMEEDMGPFSTAPTLAMVEKARLLKMDIAVGTLNAQ